MTPLVSILIPCHNAERWIAQAIESALAQTWANKEIIVVDDGSTDRSLAVIQQFDGRVRWETSPNLGGNVARNRLLELARGEWLQYLDADDWLLPGKIQDQIEFLSDHPEPDVLFGPVTLEWWSEHQVRHELLAIPKPHDPWELLANWRLPQPGALLWRKKAIRDVGGWKNDQTCCQDYELYLRLLVNGRRFIYCSASGAVYRQWSDNTVCKRNMREVHCRQLEIIQHLEDYLRGTDQLTPERRKASNGTRFRIARAVWQYDPTLAQLLARKLAPDFTPKGAAAPNPYRLIFHTLGFSAAERLATFVRQQKTFFSRGRA